MKLKLENIKHIYFLGIGGIGMSALARYFHRQGKVIHGYDRMPTPLTGALQGEGMVIHYEDKPSLIPSETDLVICTPAIPSDLQEFIYLKNSLIPMIKRSEALGMITRDRFTIAIAGSHGKTSISSMVGHILLQAGMPVTALIGGISKNYGSNCISSGKEEIMVVEADEYDRSFHTLHPDIAVITAMDPDHLDIYGSEDAMLRAYEEFAGNIKPGGKLVIRQDLQIRLRPDVRRIDYNVEERSDLSAYNLRISDHRQIFDLLSCDQQCRDVSLGLPGRHNVENAVAAAAVCRHAGAGKTEIVEGIRTYAGVNRRFDTRIRRREVVYIDDYAHHPKELQAFITAVRELYPGRRITGLFQPHLYSRTRDFAPGFAASLDLLDETWLLDIYPAREKPIEGVTSALIFNHMTQPERRMVAKEDILPLLTGKRPEVFLTMGAGDIDQMIDDIEKALLR